MKPARSYQSPSMTPPDQPDLLDVDCEECEQPALDQDRYEGNLCPTHFGDAVEWDKADDQNKANREEYGQFETDGSTG